MKKLLSFFAVALISGDALPAAPLERDLGMGLIYHRVIQLPADLPATNAAKPQARILDLRYTPGDATATNALLSWLKTNVSPAAPVFLLANPATSPALLKPLTSRPREAGIIIVGPEAPGFQPDIAVKISPDVERHAYAAFETQSDIETLLKENSDKVRNDEARLSKDRSNDAASPAAPLLDDAGRPEEKGTPVKPTRPPIDAVLQRAWYLHRGLLALKKI